MGLLITVEGGDYTGKTSVVVPALKKYFENKGLPVLVSREPGGTKKGEEIRTIIFEKIKNNASAIDLALLFNEARKIHLDEVIIPHLGAHKEKNSVVILDRFLDSTRVYQGMEQGVPFEKIIALEKKYVGTYLPDVTFILYIPEEHFEQTLSARQQHDREITEWDKQTVTDHLKRQQNYLRIPDISKSLGETRMFFLINADGEKKDVENRVKKACGQLVKKLL